MLRKGHIMRHGFKPNDLVCHPHHGVGTVGKMVEMDVEGASHRFLVVDFHRTALTLRIPERALAQSGLRRVSSKETMRAALAVLPAPRATMPGHWSRWLDAYTTKLNSGRPALLAEILRDLSPTGSSQKARLYEEAMNRLAEELALVENVERDEAQHMIEAQLAAAPHTAAPP
jgi:CarD family transcriptional regulator